ncbi:MAG TPA: dicarboxylate/amino acid:cation symporter, partial [Lacipirellulaceae bacterium]|nr:dicarboxylate/amino acid:cation symporter [Lacipirellulaceae bacterium]
IGLAIGAVAGLASRAIWKPGPDLEGIGVRMEPGTLEVQSVQADSAAGRAGVAAGDLLWKVGPAEAPSLAAAVDRFQALRSGDAIEVVFRRGAQDIPLTQRIDDDHPLATRRRLEWFAFNVAETAGQVFLRLIFMVVVPLVFSALVLGVAEIGDVRKLGRMGLRTLLMTLLLSGASVAIGLTLANTIRPGTRLPEDVRDELAEKYKDDSDAALAAAKKAKSGRDMLLDLIPKNPLQEMVGAVDGSSPGGGMLAVMVFALFVGVAITLSPERTGPLVLVLQGVYDIAMLVIGLAMRLAPWGVAGLIFALTARLGPEILRTLIWYVATVVLGLSLHMFGVYSLCAVVVARMSPRQFFGRIGDVMLTAFATSSSSATLPTALRVTEERLGVKKEVARFVLTVGSTANQNGTALYEGLTVLFLAQVFDRDLGLAQQVMVVLMSVLAGIGTAGVPGGSLPLVAMVLQTVGVPVAGIGIILGVDRVLDMCRTTVNVTGDVLVAACVDRLEGSPARPAVDPN